MRIVILASVQTKPDAGFSAMDSLLLLTAAFLLLGVLRMLGRALAPLREILRAMMSAGAVVLLLVAAFALVVISLVTPG